MTSDGPLCDGTGRRATVGHDPGQCFARSVAIAVFSIEDDSVDAAVFLRHGRHSGVTVEQDVVDAAGRHGIAVGRTSNGQAPRAHLRPADVHPPRHPPVTTESFYRLPVGAVL